MRHKNFKIVLDKIELYGKIQIWQGVQLKLT